MDDLTLEQLDTVARRLKRVLGRFDALPRHAVNYRLGEVGQNRIEPHIISRGLLELANNRRPRRGQVAQGPWRTAHGLYVSSERSPEEADELGDSVATSLVELAQLLNRGIVTELAETLSGDIHPEPRVEILGKNTTTRIAEDLDLTTDCCIARTGDRGERPVNVWFTHEQDWLYPNDPRLWEFLEKCTQEGAGAVIIARKFPLMSFALFKALNVRGLQHFATLVKEDEYESAKRLRDLVGWSHIDTVSRLRAQPFAVRLKQAVDRQRAESLSPQVRVAFAQADSMELSRAAQIAPERIVEWWNTSGLDYPRPAMLAMEQWALSHRYRPATRRTMRGHVAPMGEDRAGHPPDEAVPDRDAIPAHPARKRTNVTRIPIRVF